MSEDDWAVLTVIILGIVLPLMLAPILVWILNLVCKLI